MNITIYKSILEITNGYVRPVEYVFERIRKGNSRELVERIRLNGDGELKKRLPVINFQGVFKERKDSGITEFSGMMPLDFDKFETVEELTECRAKLQADKHTYALFTSPSGNGLKLIVRVPNTGAKDYKNYFNALKEYYDNDNFDVSSCNISRLCFESYDAEIFVNPNAEIWNDKIEPEIKPKNPVVNYSPPKYATDRKSRYIEKSFEFARKIINSSVKGNRHAARLKAGELLGGYVGGGFYSVQDALNAIEATVMNNTTLPHHVVMKEMRGRIEHGMLRPITIEQKEFERQIYLQQNQRQKVNVLTGEIM